MAVERTGRHKVIAFVLVSLGAFHMVRSVRAVQLPRDGARTEPVSIMPAKVENPVVRFAEQELQRYFQELTGEAVQVANPAAKHHIYLEEMPSEPKVQCGAGHYQSGCVILCSFVY